MSFLLNLIPPFLASVAAGQTEIYNEFSLQHELGIFLRTKLPDHKVQFERNVSFFFRQPTSFTKREIDISIFSGRADLKCAIELKYPRNGQYPEQMFGFCKDIAFAEELCAAGFARAALMICVDDSLFHRGPIEGIYGFFRGGRPLNGRVCKPTGAKNEEVTIRGTYAVNWRQVTSSLMCAIVEVAR